MIFCLQCLIAVFGMKNKWIWNKSYIFKFVQIFSIQSYAVFLYLMTISTRNKRAENFICFETPCIAGHNFLLNMHTLVKFL